MLPIKFKEFYTLTFVDVGYYNPSDPIIGVVSAPGLMCMKTKSALINGIVVQGKQGLELWATRGQGVPDNSGWERDLDQDRGLFNQAEYLIDKQLPTGHKNYFRALNAYSRFLPENKMVSEFAKIYLDEGTLTRAQRKMVDQELFAGSNYGTAAYNLDIYCCLELLAALGPQPGLDQSWIQAMIAQLKTDRFDDQHERFLFAQLDKFSHLLLPLSTQLLADWPPENRVLTLP
jgi:hypothetical protein